MFIDRAGNFYFGDKQVGDREATLEEIDIWQSLRAIAQAARDAEEADKLATIADPFVQALVSLTRAEVIAKIDADFATLSVAQRNDLKAMALAARWTIKQVGG